MSLSRGMQAKVRQLRSKIRPWLETQKTEVEQALKKAKGDKVLAASLLGIGKTTMYRKAAKFRLKPLTAMRRSRKKGKE